MSDIVGREARGAGRVWECRLWYYTTAALEARVQAAVDAECALPRDAGDPPSASGFVRRALCAYLAHLARRGSHEPDVARDPADRTTSCVVRAYAHVPAGVRSQVVIKARHLPPKRGGQQSSLVRRALLWWLRTHP